MSEITSWVFNEVTTITLSILGCLYLVCLFAAKFVKKEGNDKNVAFGYNTLFLALATDYFSTMISDFSVSEDMVQWVVLARLSLLVISFVLLVVTGSYLSGNGTPDDMLVLGLTLSGIAASVYFVFFTNDAQFVSKMSQLFPLVGYGFASVFLSNRLKSEKNSGYKLIFFTFCLITVWYFLKFIAVFKFVYDAWYAYIIIYFLMMISVLTMTISEIHKKLVDLQKVIKANSGMIEKIIKSSPLPIVIAKLTDDNIILANTNAVKLFGFDESDVSNYRMRDFFADSDNRQQMIELLEKEKELQDFEILIKKPDTDSPFWVSASASIIDYNYDIAIYMTFQDITERKNREITLKNQATRDPLTSLYNRRFFEEEVVKRIANAKNTNQPYSVMMIDADFFKKVNDTYGHKTGDKVLIELSATCVKALRDCDIVSRYGGEEFVIFLEGVAYPKAVLVADRLRETISHIVVRSDNDDEVKFTVSIGVSSSDVSDNVDMLIKTADEALYRAKQNGRNRVELFAKKDLEHFNKKPAEPEHNSHHPIFDKEKPEEVSLLEGAEIATTPSEGEEDK